VHVVTASGLPGEVDLPAEDRMSAFPREVDQAREEGVLIHPHHTLTRVIVRDGRVAAVELAAVRKLQGRDHASHRVAFEGTERVLDADMVVPAIGEVVAPTGLEAVLRGNSFISVDEHLQVAGALGIFAGGDVLGTRGTVSAAIGDGRRAAQAIDRYLRKAAKEARPVRNPVSVDRLNLTYFDHGNRRSGAISEAADRLPELEIEEPLSEADVAAEVGRCLSCGSCSACDNCWTFCPDTAVLKSPEVTIDRSHYVFDYEFCKGCGLCARECPTGFITMVDEATGKFD